MIQYFSLFTLCLIITKEIDKHNKIIYTIYLFEIIFLILLWKNREKSSTPNKNNTIWDNFGNNANDL